MTGQIVGQRKEETEVKWARPDLLYQVVPILPEEEARKLLEVGVPVRVPSVWVVPVLVATEAEAEAVEDTMGVTLYII
jgi:hypothetical protein